MGPWGVEDHGFQWQKGSKAQREKEISTKTSSTNPKTKCKENGFEYIEAKEESSNMELYSFLFNFFVVFFMDL